MIYFNFSYQCDHRHFWESSWSMVVFQFYRYVDEGFGIVRMKRFGQRCRECKEDLEFHTGFCHYRQVWGTIQCLLYLILQKCYEERPDWAVDNENYIIPVSNVPRGRFSGGSHERKCCEACAHDRCQEKYKQLTKKK